MKHWLIQKQDGDNVQSTRFLTLTATASFLLITAALYFISTSQATGYEPSIYESTPLSAWVSLMLSILCGAYITVSSLFGKERSGRFPILGICIVGFSTVTVLLIHALRGYYLLSARGDAGFHIYAVNYVLATGNAASKNFYPLIHYYIAAVYDLTGISVVDLFRYLPAFFEVVFMASIFLLASVVLPRREHAILATLAGIPLLIGSYLLMSPFAFLVLLFPFVAYVVLRSFDNSDRSFTLLAVVLAAFVALLHPLGAIILLVFLTGIWLFQRFRAPVKGEGLNLRKFAIGSNLMVLTAIIFLGWISHFTMFGNTIGSVFNSFGGNLTYASSYASTADVAQGYGYNIYEQFLKLWGGAAVYVVLSCITFVLVWNGLSHGRDLIRLKGLIGAFVLMGTVLIPFLFVNRIVSPLRIVDFVLVLCALFVGFMLFELNERLVSSKRHGKTIGVIFTCVLLLVVSISGVLHLYPSTFTLSGTEQTTNADADGNLWLLQKRLPDMYFMGLYLLPSRFQFLLPISANGSTGPYIGPGWVTSVPAHLGYDNQTRMGESVTEDVYVAFSEQSKLWYVDLYPQIASQRIQPQDFAHMQNDTTLYHLYSNGGFDAWYLAAQPPR